MRFDAAHEIKDRLSMRQVLEAYGFPLNRRGAVCCPFHREKTPSMKTTPDGKHYKCFGCGEYGGVIDFVMRLYGLTFGDALEKINDDFGLNLPLNRKMTLKEQFQLRRKRPKINTMDELDRQCHESDRIVYDALLSAYAYWDKQVAKNAPRTIEDPLTEEYGQALNKRLYMEYLMDWR